MIIRMKEYSERVTVEIDGHGRAEQITWPEAAQMLDRAYTEEIAATAEALDKYIKAAQAGIIQSPVYDEDGKQVGGYMRCTLPARPEIKGSRIILPKIKRGGHKRE